MPSNSQAEFRILADTTPVLLWISGPDKLYHFLNKRWLDFTGRTMDQEVGIGWTESVHPDDLSKCLESYNTNFDNRSEYCSEYRLKRYDGVYRWMSDRGVPHYNEEGDFVGFVGGCMDINDQKDFAQALEVKVADRTKELRESEAFLQSVLDTTQNLIYVYDFEKEKICFINGNSVKATGFTPVQIEHATTDIFAEKIHPDDVGPWLQHRRDIHDNPENKVITVEYRLKNAEGHWKHYLSRDVVFHRNHKGEPVQYIGVSTDISEIRNVNESLVFKNMELENSNFELASFSSIASHDLKEPLRKIQLFSERIIDLDDDNVSEYSQNALKRILISASRMQQLIDDLISYSQSSNEKIKFVKTDLNKLVAEVLEDLRETIEQQQAVINLDQLPTLRVLPSQIRQLFNNLISNALKYQKTDVTPTITIAIAAASKDEMSKLQGNPATKYLKITFADNGIGFPQEYSEKIFMPFKRLHGKDEYAGTGIGLAICKKIILAHKGFITAESEEGKGSVFSVYIPEKL